MSTRSETRALTSTGNPLPLWLKNDENRKKENIWFWKYKCTDKQASLIWKSVNSFWTVGEIWEYKIPWFIKRDLGILTTPWKSTYPEYYLRNDPSRNWEAERIPEKLHRYIAPEILNGRNAIRGQPRQGWLKTHFFQVFASFIDNSEKHRQIFI